MSQFVLRFGLNTARSRAGNIIPNYISTTYISRRSLRWASVAKPEWANRITAVRKQLGLLQTQFAERLQVTQAAVSQWERGASEPSAENYIRIANLSDETNCLWFLEHVGVDMSRIDRFAALRKSPRKRPEKA
jgi:DNA-binding transcriptional regulator YiaG